MSEKELLFRDSDGKVKELLNKVEGISFRENPLDFFILLARYKFAARLMKKSDRCLDAGCGHGLGTIFLSSFASEVVGADYDQDLVNKNNKEYSSVENISFKKLDLLNTADMGEFDVVVSMDVIEHFTVEDCNRVAQNYAALTKEGGFAVIGTPNKVSGPWASTRRKESHLHEFNPQEFEELLGKHFKRVFLFSMTDEVVSTSFKPLAWYLMALCTK